MNGQWMIGVVIGVGATTACADDGSAPVTVTRAQLADQIGSGPLRIEVELRADGSVREVQIEDELGHEEQLEGRVTNIDVATGRLDIEHLGSVVFSDAQRFRDGGDVSADAWLATAQAALSAGRNVWIDARGDFAADAFYANELRFDDADIKVEADVTAADYDAANGVLRIGALTFALGDARIGDDRGNDDDDDVFDDSDDDSNDDDDAFDDSDDDDDNASDDNGNDDAFDDNGGDDDASDDNGNDDDASDDNGHDDDASDDNGGDDDAFDDNGNDDDASDDNGGDDDAFDDNGSDDDGSDDDASDDDGSDDSDDSDDDHGGDNDD